MAMMVMVVMMAANIYWVHNLFQAVFSVFYVDSHFH